MAGGDPDSGAHRGLATLALTLVEGEGIWAGALAVLFVVVLYTGLVVPVRYGLGEDRLTVRFGLVRQHIPYHAIRRVQPTRNPLSSPALSLDRLRVESEGSIFRTVMISPVRRDEFLDRLAARTGLQRQGDALTKPGPGASH